MHCNNFGASYVKQNGRRYVKETGNKKPPPSSERKTTSVPRTTERPQKQKHPPSCPHKTHAAQHPSSWGLPVQNPGRCCPFHGRLGSSHLLLSHFLSLATLRKPAELVGDDVICRKVPSAAVSTAANIITVLCWVSRLSFRPWQVNLRLCPFSLVLCCTAPVELKSRPHTVLQHRGDGQTDGCVFFFDFLTFSAFLPACSEPLQTRNGSNIK